MYTHILGCPTPIFCANCAGAPPHKFAQSQHIFSDDTAHLSHKFSGTWRECPAHKFCTIFSGTWPVLKICLCTGNECLNPRPTGQKSLCLCAFFLPELEKPPAMAVFVIAVHVPGVVVCRWSFYIRFEGPFRRSTKPRGPKDQKNSRFRSRLKISIENEIFERATHRGPIFRGEIETSRLKFSSEIKNFDRD